MESRLIKLRLKIVTKGLRLITMSVPITSNNQDFHFPGKNQMIFLARAHWIPYCSKTVFKADFKAALGRQLKWLEKCFTQFRERGWNAESTSPLCHLTVKHTHACQTKRPTLLFSAQLESKCRHMLIGNLGRHKWSSSTLEPSCYLLSWTGFMLADVSWLLYSWDFGHFFLELSLCVTLN